MTWIGAGAALLAGGEVVAATPAVASATSLAVDAPVVVPAIEEAEVLTPFAQRYLSTSSGRLGSSETRQQLYQIAKEQDLTGNYTELTGDGYGPEEFIRDPLTGKGTYVDLTLKHVNGDTVRIQTIDTLADGLSPTAREALAASRIQSLRPTDKLIMVPKR